MEMKRILISSICIFIMAMTFVIGYSHSFDVHVYASNGWENADLEKQVEAFKAYCKSRNLTIDGSIANAVTRFTTNTYQSICNTLGININALQAEIKYRTDSNIGLQWFFTSSGLSAYNRIFAEFLQNNQIEVGQNIGNEVIYSAKSIDGFLIYEVNAVGVFRDNSYILKYGDVYKNYYGVNFIGTSSNEFTLFDDTGIVNSSAGGFSTGGLILGSGHYSIKFSKGSVRALYGELSNNNNTVYNPAFVLFFNMSGYQYRRLYLGLQNEYYNKPDEFYSRLDELTYINTSDLNVVDAKVYITTNNKTINQPTTINEGDTYIINNDGDVYEDDTPPTYDPYPEGGGTTGGSITTGGDGGDINFPNFNFDIPSINWSLGDLSNKFPFSIPFDLVAFYTILNAEPVAPVIDAHIPLGTWYDWHFEADFSQFDDYVVMIRNVEYIGFVVGLIYITIKFVKG